MSRFFSTLADSFIIWSRNPALLYVIILFSILLGAIWPASIAPSWELRWILLLLCVISLMSAVLAGWFSMIKTACLNHFKQSQTSPNEMARALEGFTIFKSFLPGIGQYFPSFLVGFLIQVTVALVAALALSQNLQQHTGMLDRLMALNPQDFESFIKTLSPAQREAISAISSAFLITLLGLGLFNLITMYWPVFVVLYNESAIGAYWKSICQFFRAPFTALFLSGLFVLSQVVSLSIAAIGNEFMLALGNILSLMALIYLSIALFVHLLNTLGQPTEASSDAQTEPPPVVE